MPLLTKDVLRGFLVPFGFTSSDLWSAQQTTTKEEPFADYPTPNSNSKMFVGASGECDTDTEFSVITSRAGVPTTAEFKLRNEEAGASTALYGCNQDFVFQRFEIVKEETASAKYSEPDAISFENGTILTCYEVFDPTTTTFTIEVTSTTRTGVSSSVSVCTGALFPTMVRIDKETILLIVFIEEEDKTNIDVYRSTNFGSSWSLISNSALLTEINTASGEYDVRKARTAFLNGQILLLIELFSFDGSHTNKNQIMQYASVDGGGNFVKVTTDAEITTNSFHRPSLFLNKDRFCVSYIAATDEIHFMVLPHAFFSVQSLRTAAKFTKANAGGSAGDFASGTDANMADGELSAWSAYDQTINITVKDVSDNAIVAMYGLNDTDFFSMLTNSSPTTQPSVYFGDTTESMNRFKALTLLGGSVLVCNTTQSATGDGVFLYYLGGYTNITYPQTAAYNSATIPIYRQNNTFVYIPVDVPSASSQLSKTGTGTETLNTGFTQLQVTSAQNDLKITRTQARSRNINSVTVRYVYRVVSAGSGATVANSFLRIETEESGGNLCVVEVELKETQIRVLDVSTGTPSTIATIAHDNRVDSEIIATIYEGKCAVYYRTRTSAEYELKEFSTGVFNHTLAVSATGATSQTKVIFGIDGSPTTGTAEARVYELAVSDGYGIGNMTAIDSGSSVGKKYSSKFKTYAYEGVSVFASGGSTYVNEEWKIEATSQNTIDNIFYDISPSKRVFYRSASVSSGASISAERIPLQIDAAATDIGNDIIGFHLSGINFKDFQVQYWNGAAWVTLHTFESSSGMKHGFVCSGKALKQDTTNVIDQSYYFFNELKGYTVRLESGPTVEFFTIVSNSEGGFGNVSGKKSTIILDGSPTLSSGTVFIIPSECTAVCNLNGIDASAWAINIQAQSTIHDQFRLSLLVVGSVVISGTQYSKGRNITIEAGNITTTTPDRTRYSRVVAPEQRTVQIAWSDGVDVSAFYNTNPDPDYFESSSDASAEPVAVYQDVPYLIEGVLRQCQGSHNPVVYLPVIRTDNDNRLFNRRDQHMLSLIDSEISIDSITGSENTGNSEGEVFRIATMSLIEVL